MENDVWQAIYGESKPPAHRCLLLEEVANLAVFMMADYGNMIVGDAYYISGGRGSYFIS